MRPIMQLGMIGQPLCDPWPRRHYGQRDVMTSEYLRQSEEPLPVYCVRHASPGRPCWMTPHTIGSGSISKWGMSSSLTLNEQSHYGARLEQVVWYPGVQDKRGEVVADEAILSKLDCFSLAEFHLSSTVGTGELWKFTNNAKMQWHVGCRELTLLTVQWMGTGKVYQLNWSEKGQVVWERKRDRIRAVTIGREKRSKK